MAAIVPDHQWDITFRALAAHQLQKVLTHRPIRVNVEGYGRNPGCSHHVGTGVDCRGRLTRYGRCLGCPHQASQFSAVPPHPVGADGERCGIGVVYVERDGIADLGAGAVGVALDAGRCPCRDLPRGGARLCVLVDDRRRCRRGGRDLRRTRERLRGHEGEHCDSQIKSPIGHRPSRPSPSRTSAELRHPRNRLPRQRFLRAD